MSQLMIIEGKSGSSDVRLELTSEGEAEIQKRVNKIIDQMTELSVKGLEQTLRFYRADHKALVDLIEPLVRSHIMGGVQGILKVLLKEDSDKIEVAMIEAAGKTRDTFGLSDEDIKNGVRRDGDCVRYPDGGHATYSMYLKQRARLAIDTQNARDDMAVLGLVSKGMDV